MTVKRPTQEQMEDIVADLGMSMEPARVAEFLEAMEGNFAAYDLLETLPDEKPVVKYPRTPGYRPQPEDNPHNAWYVKSEIKGAATGKLAGKTVAIKDNVCVAGVPMMNGDEETMARAPLEVANLATGMDEMANRIAQRQDELESAIIMRDAAVKETHHRVKNNLQIVSSFLSLEARNAEFVETKEVLQKARNRISALSIVHQTLYQHERVAEVHTKPFLELLLPHLEAALLMEDRQISLSFAIDDALISSDDANPLALLILELITNSVKHAFDEQGGEIIVELKDLSEDLAMTVTDNGIGETESSHKRSGTGSRLINAFVRQLSGKIEVDTDDGRRTHVVFPKK